MKKLVVLLIALVMGIFSFTATGANVVVDTPEQTKAIEWSIGYSKRCGSYKLKNIPVIRNNHRFIRKVALAPLHVLLGVSFEASYKEKNNTVKSKIYDEYGDAKFAILQLKNYNKKYNAGMKDFRVATVEDNNDNDLETIARNSDMGFIRKLTLVSDKMEYIVMPNCSLKRRMQKLGYNVFDIFMKIDAHVDERNAEETMMVVSDMQTITAEKYVDKKGCAWKPLLASASDKRKSTFLCIREDIYNQCRTWLVGGKNLKNIKMVVSKYLVYMGLQTSSSKLLKDVIGTSFAFNRIAVVKDLEIETATPKDVWFVNADNSVTRKSNHKEPLNAFDGVGIYFDDVIKRKMPKSLWKQLIKAFSCRLGIMTKLLILPQSREEYKAELAKHGHDGTITQIDNTIVNIDDVDVILTESCFKGKALFNTVKEWAQACIDNDYECAVCVQQHKKTLKDMPYQQGQLLRGNNIDALALASHAVATVQKWTKPEEAAKIIGGHLGAACEVYPALLKTRYVKKVLQDRYTQRREAMIAGKVPEVGYSVFVAPDMKPLFCHIFNLPIEYSIKEDECVLDWCEEGQDVVLTRNPDTDGCPIVTNHKKAWGSVPGVVHINPASWVPILLRLDYDGDHVLVICDPLVVKMFKQTFVNMKKLPIVWIAPSGKKTEITNATIAEALMASMAGTQTGIHSDNLTKVWNINRDVAKELIQKYGDNIIDVLIALETYNTNVDIDSTKNAANTTEKTKEARMMLSELKGMTLPEFCRYSKADEKHPADSKYWNSRCEYSGSLLDMYSKTCASRLPEMLEVKGLDNEVFCVQKIMIDPHRPMKGYIGLAEDGVRNPETKRYESEGVFNHTAFRHSKIWRLKVDAENKKTFNEMKIAIKKATLEEIEKYVSKQGGNADGAYDVITRWLFAGTDTISDGYFDVVARHYMDVYDDKLNAVLCMNLGLVPDNDIPEYDNEDED